MAAHRPDKSQGRITLAALRLLLAVAEAGSFSKAAAELDMSQSSLSEAIAGLERAVGVPLLQRVRTGVIVTPTGNQAMKHARRTLGAADDFVNAALEANAWRGELRVVSLWSAATHLLPPVIAQFETDHPLMHVIVQGASPVDEYGVAALLEQRADVGILPLPVPSGLLTFPLLEDVYMGIFPASYGSGQLELAELEGSSLLLNGKNFSCTNRVLGYLQAAGIQTGKLRFVQDDHVILSMITSGLGFSILPTLAVHPLPVGLIARTLPLPLSRLLAVATLATRSQLPTINQFINMLRSSVAASPLQVLTNQQVEKANFPFTLSNASE